MLPEHLKPKNLSQLYHMNNRRRYRHPAKGHNNVRPTQLPKLMLLDRSRLVAAAVARGVQLHHHVGLRVSRDHRSRQYLMLCTRHALHAYPTPIVVQRVPTPTAKLHGIHLMTEILYVCSPMMSFLLSRFG